MNGGALWVQNRARRCAFSDIIHAKIRQGIQYVNTCEAIKDGRLQEFIAQAEARGVGPVDREEFDTLMAALIKAPQSEGQTSRSASGDGSTERKTRQGSDSYASR
ncbi:MAG: hypothetical protein WA733_19090 [Methylocystis sp.]